MRPSSPRGFNLKSLMITTSSLLLFLCVLAGCGEPDNAASLRGAARDADGIRAGDPGQAPGYLDMKAWELAKAQMKISEEAISAFNGFCEIWSWAYEHRTFLRFKEALETADHLPGKMDEVERVVNRMRPVPGYPDLDGLKACYGNMASLLRSGAGHLRASIEAARDNNGASEKRHERLYVEKYKKAMEHYRKAFALMQLIYERGGRTEYQEFAGVKKHGPSTVGAFRAKVRKIMRAYEGPVIKKISEATNPAARMRHDPAMLKIDEACTLLQYAITETGQAEPGDLKELWDERQALLALLSYRMMSLKKYGEYLEKMKAGNTKEAEMAKKIYDILVKSADESYVKLKKAGY